MESLRVRPVTCTALLLALAVCGLFGCGKKGDPPNVILITLDTMRADHLGCYGYDRDTSPRIDAFARNATLYTRAMATSPWTVPTHASLLTGKFPFEHGAHTFKVETPVNNVNPLALLHLTLTEALAHQDYKTAAFVSNEAFLSRRWQMDQGFETYHVETAYAKELNRKVFGWLDDQRRNRFFLFINYMDTHRPYNTAPREGFLDPPAVQDQGQLLDLFYTKVMPGDGPVPAGLAQGVIDQYDTAVANLDEEIGMLLDYLVSTGLYDNTVIVITSDHGEFFGEHDLVEHSKDIYQEVLWVPLLIKNPFQIDGRAAHALTSSTDIPALILSQFPADMARHYLPEFRDVPGNHVVMCENYYTRIKDLFQPEWGKRFDRVRRVIYDWPYKYISSSDGKNELYHLEDDVREADNLIEAQRQIAEGLHAKLEGFRKTRTTVVERLDQPPLTEEELKTLKSLGYIR